MNEHEYVAAIAQLLPSTPVYFPREHCILCKHRLCHLEHREPPQGAPHDAPQGAVRMCYICWVATEQVDELLCSNCSQHAVHHHCFKQWDRPHCGICTVGRFGSVMNTAASVHVLCDLRHISLHPSSANVPADVPADVLVEMPLREEPQDLPQDELQNERGQVFQDIYRLWKWIGALVVFALVLNAVVSLFR